MTDWAPLKKHGDTPPANDDSKGTDMAKTPTPDTTDTTSTDTTTADTSTEPRRALLTVADNDNGIWVLRCDMPPTGDQPRRIEELSVHATRLGALLAAHREARRIDGGAKIITEITNPPEDLTRRCLPALCETSWRRTWLLVGLFAVTLVTTTASEIWSYPTALGILGGTLTAFAALGLAATAFTSRSRAPITGSDIHHRLVVRLAALTHAGGALLILAMSAAAQSNTDAKELGAVIVVVMSATVWLIYALVMSLMDYALEDAARSQPNSHSDKSADAAP